MLVESGIQLAGAIEVGPPRIERHVRIGRKDQGSVQSQVPVQGIADPATEHDDSGEIVNPEQRGLDLGQVEILQPQIAHGRTVGEQTPQFYK